MKILVRANNWVGDAVMAIPALQAIRMRRPDAEIVVLARPWVADLYSGQGYVDRTIVYDRDGQHRGFRGRERLAAQLRREKFDVAILFQNAFEAAWVAWRARIPQRIGYARDGRGWLLTRAIRVPRSGEIPAHESYYYLELLRCAGWLTDGPNLERISLRVPPDARRAAEQTLVRAGSKPGTTRVALAPGAAFGSAKCWAPERYAALADHLISDFGVDVIIFGARQEREMAERIGRAMRQRALNLVGATHIGDLPALLASCGLFIGNDSGAMHVAGAVGLPVVGIFGPTDPEGTHPVTPRFTLVREPVSCSPCFLRHCPIDHRCMTGVSVERVVAAVQEWLPSPTNSGARESRSARVV
jgi:heptosyltransferase-2